jgi:hypothetical protein
MRTVIDLDADLAPLRSKLADIDGHLADVPRRRRGYPWNW